MRVADATVWQQIGLAVYHRRVELGILTQGDLAQLAGVHINTVSRLERGKPLKRRSPSWAAIEAALRWPEGTIADMVDGLTREPSPTLTADVVHQVVFESVIRVALDVTGRQAHQIAADAAAELQRRGLVASE
jgi:transcriptional regulator with XRE-family HTH domain